MVVYLQTATNTRVRTAAKNDAISKIRDILLWTMSEFLVPSVKGFMNSHAVPNRLDGQLKIV